MSVLATRSRLSRFVHPNDYYRNQGQHYTFIQQLRQSSSLLRQFTFNKDSLTPP